MVTDFPIQRILDRFVERIVDVLPVEAAGVSLISPGTRPHYIAASNASALRYERLQSGLGEGPCLLAFESGEAVAVPDLRVEDRFPRFSAEALSAGLLAVFTFPLSHGHDPLGALDLYRDMAGPLSVESLEIAQTLADVASAYLLNAQAREDLLDFSTAAREASLHDGLTGLPNRVLMMDRIEHAFARGRRSGGRLAVLFIDLDRFDSINDLYGHRIGDELLVSVAVRLTAHLRPGDTLARLAGDEFVVLCEGLESAEQASAVASRLSVRLDEPFAVTGHELRVTSSIGVAFADEGTHDPEQVLHDAGTAMYEAKRRGGASAKVFKPHDHGDLGLPHDLRYAVARDELRLVYQPIVTTASGGITGLEALLRWDHPTRGLILPTVMIPIAERSGVIVDIGRWVLEQALSSWGRWRHMPDGQELRLAVNVSGYQLMSNEFAQSVSDLVWDTGTDMYALTLDVTESAFISDPPRTRIVMNSLKELGMSLALDNFGTGYSSLRFLRQFPLDVLKMDRGLVAGLGHDRAGESMVGAVSQVAHAHGMNVIAEGVETAEQRSHAGRLGCDLSQGYYFAAPMSADDVTSLLARHDPEGAPRLPLPALPGR